MSKACHCDERCLRNIHEAATDLSQSYSIPGAASQLSTVPRCYKSKLVQSRSAQLYPNQASSVNPAQLSLRQPRLDQPNPSRPKPQQPKPSQPNPDQPSSIWTILNQLDWAPSDVPHPDQPSLLSPESASQPRPAHNGTTSTNDTDPDSLPM